MSFDVLLDYFELRDSKIIAKRGQVSYETSTGFYIPSSLVHLWQAFRELKLKGKFLDAGSGDGRVVALASMLGLDAYGIESEPELVKESIIINNDLKNKQIINNFTIKQNDFENEDLSQFDIIYNFVNSVEKIETAINKTARKGILFLLYDTANIPTKFERLKLQKTITMRDKRKQIGNDLPRTIDYLHIYKK